MYTLLYVTPFLFLLFAFNTYIVAPVVKFLLSPSKTPTRRITQKEIQTPVDELNSIQRNIDNMKHVTHTPFSESLAFSGMYTINTNENLLLVTSCSLGAKFGFMLERMNDTMKVCEIAGTDIVNECITRNVVHSGRPLFFSHSVESGVADDKSIVLISAMANACKSHGCSMLGGNFTESPDMGYCMSASGTLVSTTSTPSVLDGSRVREGDLIYGITSSSPHSSEYGLLNIIYPVTDIASISQYPELLNSYSSNFRELYPLTSSVYDVHGMIHMGAGGWDENMMKLVGKRGFYAEWNNFKFSPLYTNIQERTRMGREEMLKTFSCGFSVLVIVSSDNVSTNYTDTWTLVGEIKSL